MTRLLDELIVLQKRYNDSLENCFERLELLLERSEARIDKTNDMICSLAKSASNLEQTLAHITKEYCTHIDSLANARDTVMEQNKALVLDHLQDREEIRQLRTEQRELSNQLLTLVADLSRNQSGGVKIENNLGDDSH